MWLKTAEKDLVNLERYEKVEVVPVKVGVAEDVDPPWIMQGLCRGVPHQFTDPVPTERVDELDDLLERIFKALNAGRQAFDVNTSGYTGEFD